MSMPVRVTILSREDCHLCEVVHRIVLRLESELHIETHKVPIEHDRVLMERYGTRVPVLLLDEVEHFAGKVTEGERKATAATPTGDGERSLLRCNKRRAVFSISPARNK